MIRKRRHGVKVQGFASGEQRQDRDLGQHHPTNQVRVLQRHVAKEAKTVTAVGGPSGGLAWRLR